MSVSSAAEGRPAPSATSTIARASSRASSRVGQEGARADLDVHDEPVEPGGELLGEDGGDDERERLDRRRWRRGSRRGGGRPGRARAVWPTIAQPASPTARAQGGRARASRRSPGWRRACRACRRCGRGRGRRSSARRRRRRRRSARAAARPCRPRRRSSACRARGGRRSASRARCPSRVIARGQRDALGARSCRAGRPPSPARRPGRR